MILKNMEIGNLDVTGTQLTLGTQVAENTLIELQTMKNWSSFWTQCTHPSMYSPRRSLIGECFYSIYTLY